MKAPLILAAALTLLAGMPLAQAFQTVQSSTVPAANAARVADPEDVMESIDNQSSTTGGVTTPLGNQLRFGASPSTGGGIDPNGPFLESPASRTVPSQQR